MKKLALALVGMSVSNAAFAAPVFKYDCTETHTKYGKSEEKLRTASGFLGLENGVVIDGKSHHYLYVNSFNGVDHHFMDQMFIDGFNHDDMVKHKVEKVKMGKGKACQQQQAPAPIQQAPVQQAPAPIQQAPVQQAAPVQQVAPAPIQQAPVQQAAPIQQVAPAPVQQAPVQQACQQQKAPAPIQQAPVQQACQQQQKAPVQQQVCQAAPRDNNVAMIKLRHLGMASGTDKSEEIRLGETKTLEINFDRHGGFGSNVKMSCNVSYISE